MGDGAGRVVAALLAGGFGVTLACGRVPFGVPAANTGKGHAGMPQTLVLREADQGSVKRVTVGQDVTVAVEENPTTGYRWALVVEPAGAAEVEGSEYIAGGSALGASGQRKFHLRTKAAGTVKLHLKLWREWQGEGSVTERREFLLQVGQ